MIDMKPVAWCLITYDGKIINGVHEEERQAAGYRHRISSDTLTPLYAAEQLAQSVAVERERCATMCEGERLGFEAGDPSDISYGVAVEHCIAVIRGNAP